MYICYDFESMALSEYQGLPSNTGILRFMVGESVKAAFVDAQGHIWLIVPSGHAMVFSGYNFEAEPFQVMGPEQVKAEIDKRKGELQKRIQGLRMLAPGIDI